MSRPSLTVEQILGWADSFRERTGRWPTPHSGPIPESNNWESWSGVNESLRHGRRGLSAGSSLARLLAEQRGLRNRASLKPLSEDLIVAWARAHQHRHGRWPDRHSGPIPESPGDTWKKVNHALRDGRRGLSGGSSLARLLAQRLGVRNMANVTPLTVEQILGWADSYRDRTGQWPRHTSGPIPGAPGETWGAVEFALRNGRRNLSGGSSLYKLLKEHRQISGRRPPVRRIQIRTNRRGRPKTELVFPAELLDRCRAGEIGPREVARMCKVSLPVARRELQKAGVKIRRGKRATAATLAMHEAVIEQYKSGQSLRQVARTHGLTYEGVRQILLRHKITPRDRLEAMALDSRPAAKKEMATRLTELRRKVGMSRSQLAARSGLHVNTIAKLEAGRTSATLPTVTALAQALNVPLGDLWPQDQPPPR
jgi:DNA-binding XRE family transcriptional regulator